MVVNVRVYHGERYPSTNSGLARSEVIGRWSMKQTKKAGRQLEVTCPFGQCHLQRITHTILSEMYRSGLQGRRQGLGQYMLTYVQKSQMTALPTFWPVNPKRQALLEKGTWLALCGEPIGTTNVKACVRVPDPRTTGRQGPLKCYDAGSRWVIEVFHPMGHGRLERGCCMLSGRKTCVIRTLTNCARVKRMDSSGHFENPLRVLPVIKGSGIMNPPRRASGRS